jgi:ABC-type sugar transport system substrate-binding protein
MSKYKQLICLLLISLFVLTILTSSCIEKEKEKPLVGFSVPNLWNPFYTSLTKGMKESSAKFGLNLFGFSCLFNPSSI